MTRIRKLFTFPIDDELALALAGSEESAPSSAPNRDTVDGALAAADGAALIVRCRDRGESVLSGYRELAGC